MIAGTEDHELARGDEYVSHLIEARKTGNPVEIYVNVANIGLIDNVPSDGVVEVAATIDADGVHPQPFGRLPSQFAAPAAVHMAFHDLVATSVLEQDREAAIHALMIDPLTSAVCSLAEIRELFEEMVAAERDSLPGYVVGERQLDLVVIGDINPDLVVAAPDLRVEFGQREVARRQRRAAPRRLGGNHRLCASRLGLSVAFCGLVGDDH